MWAKGIGMKKLAPLWCVGVLRMQCCLICILVVKQVLKILQNRISHNRNHMNKFILTYLGYNLNKSIHVNNKLFFSVLSSLKCGKVFCIQFIYEINYFLRTPKAKCAKRAKIILNSAVKTTIMSLLTSSFFPLFHASFSVIRWMELITATLILRIRRA